MNIFNRHIRRAMPWLLFLFLLASCGGGGGGGAGGGGNNGGGNNGGGYTSLVLNGAAVAGGVSINNPAVVYTMNVTAGTAYTVATVATSDSVTLTLFNGDPAAGGTGIGFSWNTLPDTTRNSVSFIANFTGTVYIVVQVALTNPATYTVQAYNGDLALNASRSAATYNKSINYSFDATAGAIYQVQLTPQTGDVNIGAVAPALGASVGSSTFTGTTMDTVTFQAAATQRYYITVDSTSVDSTFNINVTTATADPDLTVAVDSAVSDGANVTVNYTVSNRGVNPAVAFAVTLWSDSASIPTVGSAGQATSATIASLASGATATGTAIIANAGTAGTAYAIVDNANGVVENNESNNVSTGKAWLKPLMAPLAFNFENGLVPSGMLMSGTAGWLIDATSGSASTTSLKTGAIGNSQTSCVSFSAANATSITFDYAVSSEAGFDLLRFYIDGTQRLSWSGTVPWSTTAALTVTNTLHEFKWCYTKDLSVSAGADAAWIDNITLN